MNFILVEFVGLEWVVRTWSHDLGTANRMKREYPNAEIYVSYEGAKKVQEIEALRERLARGSSPG